MAPIGQLCCFRSRREHLGDPAKMHQHIVFLLVCLSVAQTNCLYWEGVDQTDPLHLEAAVYYDGSFAQAVEGKPDPYIETAMQNVADTFHNLEFNNTRSRNRANAVHIVLRSITRLSPEPKKGATLDESLEHFQKQVKGKFPNGVSIFLTGQNTRMQPGDWDTEVGAPTPTLYDRNPGICGGAVLVRYDQQRVDRTKVVNGHRLAHPVPISVDIVFFIGRILGIPKDNDCECSLGSTCSNTDQSFCAMGVAEARYLHFLGSNSANEFRKSMEKYPGRYSCLKGKVDPSNEHPMCGNGLKEGKEACDCYGFDRTCRFTCQKCVPGEYPPDDPFCPLGAGGGIICRVGTCQVSAHCLPKDAGCNESKNVSDGTACPNGTCKEGECVWGPLGSLGPDGTSGGLDWWIYVIIVVAALVILALIVAAVLVSRRRSRTTSSKVVRKPAPPLAPYRDPTLVVKTRPAASTSPSKALPSKALSSRALPSKGSSRKASKSHRSLKK